MARWLLVNKPLQQMASLTLKSSSYQKPQQIVSSFFECLSINGGCLLVLPAFHQKASLPSSEALRTETDSKGEKEEVFNIQRLEKE